VAGGSINVEGINGNSATYCDCPEQ